jgi:hypothetical protein
MTQNNTFLPKSRANRTNDVRVKPDLRTVAGMLGLHLPADGTKFCSPIRRDNKPSCWIHNDRLFDGATGENFDAVALYAAVKGISNGEAFKTLCGKPTQRFAGVASKKLAQKIEQVSFPPPMADASKAIAQAAQSRSLPEAAFRVASVYIGTLRFAEIFGLPCWYVFDAAGIGWEARRCDGKPFEPFGRLQERKSHAKGQGLKSWPVGIMPPKIPSRLTTRTPVVMVEGGPDYIAACALALQVKAGFLPVAMLGKSASIAADALPLFHGRKVLIFGHNDAEQRIASWAAQLVSAGAEVHAKRLHGGDMNDLVSQSDKAAALAATIEEILS